MQIKPLFMESLLKFYNLGKQSSASNIFTEADLILVNQKSNRGWLKEIKTFLKHFVSSEKGSRFVVILV